MKTANLLNRTNFKSEAAFIQAFQLRKANQARINRRLNRIACITVIALFCIAIIAGI